MDYIIELEKGVWLADGEGDPPRTLRAENARRFPNVFMANDMLEDVKESGHRLFLSAKISRTNH